MTEYLNKKDLLDFIKDTRQRLPQDSKDFFTRDNMLLNFEQYVGLMPSADVAEVSHGKWILTVEQGSCYDYHVTAHCSKCGWEWIGKDSECVGNNKYVFAAFIQGNKEIAEQFALDNAKQRHLYDYCPNCYAKMDLGDDE